MKLQNITFKTGRKVVSLQMEIVQNKNIMR